MNDGRFRKNTLSTGDLNRPRSPEVRKPLVCFLVLFAQRKKNKPVPFPGSFEVLQTSNQRTKTPTSHRTKANKQLQILSATTYCELAVQ